MFGNHLNEVSMGATEPKQGRKVPCADNSDEQVSAHGVQGQLEPDLGLQAAAARQLTLPVIIQNILQLVK